MELIVRHGEREEELHLETRENGGFSVRVGERTYEVDVAHAGRLSSLRLLGGADEGRQFEVATRHIRRRGQADSGYAVYEVSRHGGVDRVEITDPLSRLAEAGAESGTGASTVLAYMPGRVVEVLVAEGSPVAKGQGIVVLEAMKMKNEIQSEIDGLVVRLHVEQGQAVEGGDPLFEIGSE